jgi:hypothetical protein
MIMKSYFAFITMSGVAVAALIASAFAQDTQGPGTAQSADNLPLQSTTNDFAQSSALDTANRLLHTTTQAQDTFHMWGTADPAMQKLATEERTIALQAEGLFRQLEAANSDDRRNEIKAKLSEVLGKQFDARQKRHGLEIAALAAQVKKLRELVEKRQENRAEIIARKLDQIIRESQGLGF